MTDISAAIGKRIRTFRNAQGISLEELSFKADLNAAHLGQIERGLRNPTIETLNRIATALDISFYELIGSVEEVPQKQPETNEIKRKIDAQLSSMTLDEQKDILRIIRIFRRRFDEENKKTDRYTYVVSVSLLYFVVYTHCKTLLFDAHCGNIKPIKVKLSQNNWTKYKEIS